MVKKAYISFFFWLISLTGFSQSLISYTTVSPDNAYIGQPVQLKVSVFTTTWFTKGVDVGNIQVDGALTVYFRSLSNSRIINGKKYAGVDFYYNLFPTKEGTITVPVLEIQVETPKEGGYKGIPRTLKTKPKRIVVKGVPLGYDPNNWLVARSLNVSQKWSMPLNSVKVGDVVQRTIKRSAAGTLAEFIPATLWDSIEGVSIYPKRPLINTHKSKTGVSSTRTETVSYLFEKDGKVVIPAIEYIYWNSGTHKFYKKKIDSVTVQVQPNADLTMLASIKKSLQEEQPEAEESEEKPFLILGMTPKEFIKYLIIALIAVFLFIRIFKYLKKKYLKNRKIRLQSEAYAFKKLSEKIKKNDYPAFIKNVNSWVLKLDSGNSTFREFVNHCGTSELKEILFKMDKTYFKELKTCNSHSFRVLNRTLKESRALCLKQKKKKNVKKESAEWLNPTS